MNLVIGRGRRNLPAFMRVRDGSRSRAMRPVTDQDVPLFLDGRHGLPSYGVEHYVLSAAFVAGIAGSAMMMIICRVSLFKIQERHSQATLSTWTEPEKRAVAPHRRHPRAPGPPASILAENGCVRFAVLNQLATSVGRRRRESSGRTWASAASEVRP